MAESPDVDDKLVSGFAPTPENSAETESFLAPPPPEQADEELTESIVPDEALPGSKDVVDQEAASSSPRAVDEPPSPLPEGCVDGEKSISPPAAVLLTTTTVDAGVEDVESNTAVEEPVAAVTQEDNTANTANIENASVVPEVAQEGILEGEEAIESPEPSPEEDVPDDEVAPPTSEIRAAEVEEPVEKTTTASTEIDAPAVDDAPNESDDEVVPEADEVSSEPVVPDHEDAASSSMVQQETALAPEANEVGTVPTDADIAGSGAPPDAADLTVEQPTAAPELEEAIETIPADDEEEPVDAKEPVEEFKEDSSAPVEQTVLSVETTEAQDAAEAPATIVNAEQEAVVADPAVQEALVEIATPVVVVEDSAPSEPVEPVAVSAAVEAPNAPQLSDAESTVVETIVDDVGATGPEGTVQKPSNELEADAAPVEVGATTELLESGNEGLVVSPVEGPSDAGKVELATTLEKTELADDLEHPDSPTTSPTLASPTRPSDPLGEVSEIAELAEVIPTADDVASSAIGVEGPGVAKEEGQLDSTTDDPLLVEVGVASPHVAVSDATSSNIPKVEEATAPVSPKKLHIPAAFLAVNEAAVERLSPKGGSSQSPIRKLTVPAAFSGGLENTTDADTDLTPPDLGTPKKLVIPTAFAGSGKSPEIESSTSNTDVTPTENETPKKLVIPSAFSGERATSPVTSSSPVNTPPKTTAEPAAGISVDAVAPVVEAEHPLSEHKEMNAIVPSELPEETEVDANATQDAIDVSSEEVVAIETEYIPEPSPSGTPSKLQIPSVFASHSNDPKPSTSDEDSAPRQATPDRSPGKLIIPSAIVAADKTADDVKPVPVTKEPHAVNDLPGAAEKSAIPSTEESEPVAPLSLPENERGVAKPTKSQLLQEIKRVEKEMAAVKAQSRAATSDATLTEPEDSSGQGAVPQSDSVEGDIEQKAANASDDAESVVDPSAASVNISLHSDPGTIPVVPHYSVTAGRHAIEPCLEAPEDEVEETSPKSQEPHSVKPSSPFTSTAENVPKSPTTEADAATAAPSETTPEKAIAITPSTESGKVTSPLPSPTNSEPVLSNCGSCNLL